ARQAALPVLVPGDLRLPGDAVPEQRAGAERRVDQPDRPGDVQLARGIDTPGVGDRCVGNPGCDRERRRSCDGDPDGPASQTSLHLRLPRDPCDFATTVTRNRSRFKDPVRAPRCVAPVSRPLLLRRAADLAAAAAHRRRRALCGARQLEACVSERERHELLTPPASDRQFLDLYHGACCGPQSMSTYVLWPLPTVAARHGALAALKAKSPVTGAFQLERMMGLEPTTFCMASRRSSQLSYIRERGQYSPGRREPVRADPVRRDPSGAVEGLVHEPVCELVVLPADGAIADAPELARECGRAERELAQRLVLHAVLARHLLDEELRVRDDLDLVDAELERLLEAGDEGAVLGHVVGRDPDALAFRREDGAVVGLEDEAVRGGARVAARAAVGGEARLHRSTSTSGYTSNA